LDERQLWKNEFVEKMDNKMTLTFQPNVDTCHTLDTQTSTKTVVEKTKKKKKNLTKKTLEITVRYAQLQYPLRYLPSS
jgi:hypothetical protein